MLGLAQKVQSSKKIDLEAKKLEVRKPGVFLLFFPIDTFIIICPPPWPEAKEKSFAEQMNFLGLRPGGWAFNF